MQQHKITFLIDQDCLPRTLSYTSQEQALQKFVRLSKGVESKYNLIQGDNCHYSDVSNGHYFWTNAGEYVKYNDISGGK